MSDEDALEFAAAMDEDDETVTDEPKKASGAPMLEKLDVADEEEEETPKLPQKAAPKKEAAPAGEEKKGPRLFAMRTTANREDQVADFIASNVKKKKLEVYAVIRPHGMRGYIFLEAKDAQAAEQSGHGVPYARGILGKEVEYREIEHMLEQVKKEMNIRKNDIVEIISGPFKREQAKISRVDDQKEEVVVELLGAAVPIPITVKMDAVKVIRRDSADESGGAQKDAAEEFEMPF